MLNAIPGFGEESDLTDLLKTNSMSVIYCGTIKSFLHQREDLKLNCESKQVDSGGQIYFTWLKHGADF